ncbi:MAG: EamA family transporter RarD [Sphingomicrobium sp.]
MNAAPPPRHPAAATDHRRARIGVACGLAAYTMWGFLPAYFKLLANVSPVDIVAHRIVWSMLFLAVGVSLAGGWRAVGTALATPSSRRLLLITATLIGTNWLLYVYAINSGHILAGSLGYYLNPLANILLGRFLLSERLSRLQWAAVALAGAGVAVLIAGALDTLWISLTLCFSFALYGLLRKRVTADSVTGLTVETILLFPLALGWLAFGAGSGRAVLGAGPGELALLAASGILSTTPLLLFTEAARRLNYSTVGMLQFIAPTLQFLLAVWVYGEHFTTAHAIAFAAIWSALALYVSGSIRKWRMPLPE